MIKRSDEAFKQLVDYFEKQSEPTIIMMFGDHQPADYITNVVDTGKVMDEGDDSISSIGTGSDRKERYIVPFVMWANYDIDESQGEETSANYLAVRLLKAAGLPLTDFQSYLSDLEQEVPFVSAHVLKENQETESSTDTADNLLKVYKKLLYNDLFDTKHRLENFFSY
ncbi:MAG: sulfatase-like hydrolase/transferase [Coprococcus sp.]